MKTINIIFNFALRFSSFPARKQLTTDRLIRRLHLYDFFEGRIRSIKDYDTITSSQYSYEELYFFSSPKINISANYVTIFSLRSLRFCLWIMARFISNLKPIRKNQKSSISQS